MSNKTAIRRVTRRDADTAVASLQDFKYNNSATGQWGTKPTYGGYLSPAEWGDLKDHVADAETVFVVRSYETPIGAYVPGKGWWICTTKFSPTTTTHQGFLVSGIKSAGHTPSAVSGDDNRWSHVFN